MQTLRSALLPSILLTLMLPSLAFSQSPPADFSANSSSSLEAAPPAKAFFRDYHELSLYTGQSFGYVQLLSSLPDQRLFMIGGRWTSHFFDLPHTTVNWNADVKPLALYSNDYYQQTGFTYIAGPRQYTYGGGGGIGLQFLPHQRHGFQPFFDVDGGFLAFTKDTPIPNSRRVNITFDFGPGFYIPAGHNQSIKTGAQFFHFSNADTARRNPSFDSVLIYVAYSFRNIHLSHHSQ